MNKIQTLLTAVLLFGISGSGVADFDDGYDAYQKGDYKTALNEWQPLAKQGHAGAQTNLGLMYDNGRGVLKDDKEAVKWYLKAAEQGYASAQVTLGKMYGGVLRDDKEAFKWIRKAAEQDNADAQIGLGLMHASSKGVSKDLSKARYWIKKAYENPNAETRTVELAEENWNNFELWKY